MFSKLCDSGSDSPDVGQKKRFKIFSKMTAPGLSGYEKMEEGVEKKKKRKMRVEEDTEADKENDGAAGKKEPKKLKKKRSWKRFRQVALTTCRYMGMGVAHLSPATTYYSPDYCMDPKAWDRSFSPSYKQKLSTTQQRSHWSNAVLFSPGY